MWPDTAEIAPMPNHGADAQFVQVCIPYWWLPWQVNITTASSWEATRPNQPDFADVETLKDLGLARQVLRQLRAALMLPSLMIAGSTDEGRSGSGADAHGTLVQLVRLLYIVFLLAFCCFLGT